MGAIHVFHDGTDYFVADGFHRTLAAIRAKRSSIPCTIHKGTAKDARIFGMTANDQHGLRMSHADKVNCVEWLLDNGGKMSHSKIAEKAGVSRSTVTRVLADRKAATYPPDGENASETQSGGQVAEDGKAAETTRPQGGGATKAGGSGSTAGNAGGKKDDNRPAETGKTGEESPPAEPPKREEWRTARSKAKKTVEALMRALDDLNDVKPLMMLKEHLDDCAAIILELDAMS
jgi:ParB-like chromosome segregation protein Spo0J